MEESPGHASLRSQVLSDERTLAMLRLAPGSEML